MRRDAEGRPSRYVRLVDVAAAGALTSSSSAAPAGDMLVNRFLYKLSFPFAKKEGEHEDVAPGGCTG